MKILAIDPATYQSGYVIVDENRHVYTEGSISAPSKQKLPDRLLHIFNAVEGLIKSYRPDVLAIETPFYGNNYKTSSCLNQLQGILKLLSAMHDIELKCVSPLEASNHVMKKKKKKYSPKKNLYGIKKVAVGKEMRKLYKTKTMDHDITDAYSIAEFVIFNQDITAL